IIHTQTRAERVRADQGRVSGMKPGARLPSDRQQLFEAPHVSRALFNDVARQRVANACIVVDNFERPQTLIADPERLGGKFGPAEVALQPRHERHASPSQWTFTVLTVHAIRSLRRASRKRASTAAVLPVANAAMDGPAPLKQKPITSGCRTASSLRKPGTSRWRYG